MFTPTPARAGANRLATAACAAVLAALFLAATPGASGARGVPHGGFFGVSPQTQVTSNDLRRMARLSLTLRIPFFWFDVEARRGSYDFATLDRTVGEASAAGVRVLPIVTGSPEWMAGDPRVAPLAGRRARAWSAFLRELVGRYGPGGKFWEGREVKQPLRRWQIWNEPNFSVFWRRPSPRAYVGLLRRSAAAIRGLDPGAQIVAGGLAPVEGGLRPWEFLRRMYLVPGAGAAFDVAALHPYATSIPGLEYELRAVRRVMARAGDGAKPLLVTELGVASDGVAPNPFDKGRRGQGRFLEGAYRLMLEHRRRWRLGGAYWFTWKDVDSADPYCVFCRFAGLFDVDGRPKPAWNAFRRVVRAASVR
ncbi:MAG TPA: hypothetical protein VKA35_05515 [Solirubrobacterales bacterium]|nr:hypothetical protein [Solirubrobacterales bacterium]